jgi:hypothetical protein
MARRIHPLLSVRIDREIHLLGLRRSQGPDRQRGQGRQELGLFRRRQTEEHHRPIAEQDAVSPLAGTDGQWSCCQDALSLEGAAIEPFPD